MGYQVCERHSYFNEKKLASSCGDFLSNVNTNNIVHNFNNVCVESSNVDNCNVSYISNNKNKFSIKHLKGYYTIKM